MAYVIKLKKNNNSIVVKHITRNVQLKHVGKRGLQGEQGVAGVGVPTGGASGQVLTKDSGTDYDTSWQDPTGGGASDWGDLGGTLSDQTDLQSALDSKYDASNPDGFTTNTGDVVGTGTSAENHLPRYTDTTGKEIKPTDVWVDNANDMGGINTINAVNSYINNAQISTAQVTGLLNVDTISEFNTGVGVTIQGRNIETDGSKLDGIEALADVTDATNVAAAGAVMTSGDQTVGGEKTFTGVTTVDGNAGTTTTAGNAALQVTGTTDVKYVAISGPTAQPLRITDTRATNAFNGAGVAIGVDDGAAMASGDREGYVLFYGNDGAALRNSVSFSAYAADNWSSNNFPSYMVIDTAKTNSRIENIRFGGTGTAGVTVNELGNDQDFRVEGDTDQNLLFTDASTDRVGVGISSPSSKLHVDGGDIEVDDIASGVIIKSADGTRWRITVANDGSLTTASI